jgi:hypothetical protein
MEGGVGWRRWVPRWGAVIFVRVNQVLVRLWTPQAVESLTGKCALVL